MGLNNEYNFNEALLDEDDKVGLKRPSVSTRWELNQLEHHNIEKAFEWTIHRRFSVDFLLTKEFIKKLHHRMLGDVWEWAGTFRKTNMNLGVDWTKIEIELKILLDDTKYWIKNETYEPDEIAIRFKHRLVKIQCFPNGNGRHSRLLADIIIEKGLGLDVFTWSKSSKLNPDEIRKEYIRAINLADSGDLHPLIKFARS